LPTILIGKSNRAVWKKESLLGKRAFANRFFQESVDEGAEFEVEYLPTFSLWGRKAGGRKTLAGKKAILPDSGVKG
jgi:hypothetical protein